MRPPLLPLTAAALSTMATAAGLGYADPKLTGGSMLTSWPNTTGNHEPLNVIISGNSDSRVLSDSLWKGRLQNYMISGKMAPEFLGIHLGTKQLANLDGNGEHEQIRVMRYDYGDPLVGTGRESLAGGNHLRYWCHSTGAYFLAVSAEEDVGQKHTIIPDGYNVGRDQFVGTLVGKDVATRSVKAGDTFEVETSWNGWTYRTDAEYVAGLLDATSEGINHADTVGVDGKPSVDGLVAVLTVSITQKEIF